jgi:hypothetical protein
VVNASGLSAEEDCRDHLLTDRAGSGHHCVTCVGEGIFQGRSYLRRPSWDCAGADFVGEDCGFGVGDFDSVVYRGAEDFSVVLVIDHRLLRLLGVLVAMTRRRRT